MDSFSKIYERAARQFGDPTYDRLRGFVTVACEALDLPEATGTRLYEIIAQAYSNSGRSFHALQHAAIMTRVTKREITALDKHTNLTMPGSELDWIMSCLTLGGFTHDAVYLQVDGARLDGGAQARPLTSAMRDILKPYVTITEHAPYSAIIHQDHSLTNAVRAVLEVYGFYPGQKIAVMATPEEKAVGVGVGLNEFLSSLVVARILEEGAKEPTDVAQAIVVLSALHEATIPFRPSSTFDALFKRVNGILIHAERAKLITKMAVVLANRDVEGFCGGLIEQEDSTMLRRVRAFLGGTWQLMPEMQPKLRGTSYSAMDFLQALVGNLAFLDFIMGSGNIFHSFKDFPNSQEMTVRQNRLEENRDIMRHYLTAKIASAGIVTAIGRMIAEAANLRDLVNGITVDSFDMPEHLSWLEVNANDTDAERHHKEKLAVTYATLRDRGDGPVVYMWDTPSSPIAAYLLETVGEAGVYKIAQMAKSLLKVQSHYTTPFLDFLNVVRKEFPQALEAIETAIYHVGENRLLQLGEERGVVLTRMRALNELRGKTVDKLAL